MSGAVVSVDEAVRGGKKQQRSEATSYDMMMNPSYSEEYTGIKKAVMERDGRGKEWWEAVEREREAEKDSGKGEGKLVRAGIVNERILRALRNKEERVRKAITIVSPNSNGVVQFDELRQGLRAAGLLLGDGDCKAVWAAAGGSVYVDGGVSGTVNLDSFMKKMDKQVRDWEGVCV